MKKLWANPVFREKMIKSQTGKSQEFREKVSRFMKGNKYSVGRKLSEEHKEKIRLASIRNGNRPPSSVGRVWTLESRDKARKSAIKRGISLELRRKMIESRKRNGWNAPTGHEAPGWRGGVSKPNELARKCVKFRIWRKSVFERDDYTCQICRKRGGTLHPDHIKRFADFPELRYEITNGRTLCVNCHRKTPTYGNHKNKTNT